MYVIQNIMPDGPHWFEGYRRIQKEGHVIQGPQFTPYWEDVLGYENEQDAQTDCDKLNQSSPGCEVVPVRDALYFDAWGYIDNNTYSIRAKYLKEGQRVLVSGYSTPFNIIKRDQTNFHLKAEHGGYYIKIGVHSNKKVIVILKPPTDETSSTSKQI